MKYQHDCDRCQFIAHADGKDWYVHPPVNDVSGCVIGRYGDDGGENLAYPIPELKSRSAPVPSNFATAKRALECWEYVRAQTSLPWCMWCGGDCEQPEKHGFL